MKILDNTYLVGGAVRDTLLGKIPNDRDYVVVGATASDMLSLGFIQVGKDFPVFIHPKTKEEYALARTERKKGYGYKGFSIDACSKVTLEEDLARRDLTINAMALGKGNSLVDPFNGFNDLQNKVLRHTTAAFIEDPVRVLRVARFMARFGEQWSIAPETQDLMQTLKNLGELKYLVPERIWAETAKALSAPHPQLYFQTLNGLGIFPEIEAMVGLAQPAKYHPEGDVFTHTMLALKRAANLNFDQATRFAALTHDFGKPVSFQKQSNFLGHEQAGIEVINKFCQRLNVPERLRKLAILTSDNHTRCHKLFEMKASKVHKLIVETMDAVKKPERFQQFLQACLCDAQGRGQTFEQRDYPQYRLALLLLKNLSELDTKSIVQHALSLQKQGPEIGQFIRQAELACVKQTLLEKEEVKLP